MAGRERQETAMVGNIDVRTEVRKITSSKPVYAAAGAGVLATQTLRQLPGRLVRWGFDGTVTSLPARATGYVQNVRAKAVDGYDMLADRGKKVLDGQNGAKTKGALNGKASGRKSK
jgi:hypothetical protein